MYRHRKAPVLNEKVLQAGIAPGSIGTGSCPCTGTGRSNTGCEEEVLHEER